MGKRDVSGWDSLTPAEQAAYGNGVGPWWFPAGVRLLLTRLSATFFREADWGRHDYGYATKAAPRAVCDLRFLQAMLRDASQLGRLLDILIACGLAWLFWGLCRIGGWASYGHRG